MSNQPPKGIELTNPDAYREQFARLVGDQNPIDVLKQTHTKLYNIFDRPGITEMITRRPYADRWTWTPLEVVGHLIDFEIGFAFRIRSVLGDDRPTLTGYDQDKWVSAQNYNDRNLAKLLPEFIVLRTINLQLWENVTPEQMSRVGIHAERGEESLQTMLTMHAGHDLHHLKQIEKYLDAMR